MEGRNYDELQILFGFDYKVTDFLTIHQPKVGEILEYGEQQYFSMVYTLTATPTNMMSVLDDMGIDYTKISDFELFLIIASTMPQEQTEILLGDLDLSAMRVGTSNINGLTVLGIPGTDYYIDEYSYQNVVDYIRKMHGIVPDHKKAGNAITKRFLIEEDRRRRNKMNGQKFESTLFPLVVSMLNTEEFKYNSREILNIGVCEFLESVKQIQKKKNAMALLQGSYSGMVDTSKIDKNAFNWLYSTEKPKQKTLGETLGTNSK